MSGLAAFEYNLGNLVFAFISAAIGFNLGVVMLVVYTHYREQSNLVIAIFGGILFVLATIYAFMLLYAVFKAKVGKNTVEVLAKNDGFHVSVYKGEDLAKEYDISYQKVLYYRVARHYIFVYFQKQVAFPLEKSGEWVEYLSSLGLKKK